MGLSNHHLLGSEQNRQLTAVARTLVLTSEIEERVQILEELKRKSTA